VGVDDERVYVNNIFNFRTYDAASGDQVWMFEVDEKTRTIDAAFMDDRIYLVAEKHPGSEETVSEEFERLYALDATTGDVIWQHERLAASGDDWNVHAEGGTVYVAHRSGILQAFASDGTERWRTDLDSSLTYADESMAETLYLSDGHRLIAIDASDGQIRWKREGCEAPPQTADGRVYCTAGNVSTGIRYSAVDASSIGQLWETEFRAHSGGVPVVALDSVLYASLWFEGGRRLYALDATSGCRFGYFEFDADGMTAPLVAEDSVYVGVRGGEQALYALETVHT
jgi:outer membrane protein assembly factor BamB